LLHAAGDQVLVRWVTEGSMELTDEVRDRHPGGARQLRYV
jgi:hypothetical protein